MTTLTYAQLEGVWLQAAAGTKYDTQTWAALMAAIAEAESGGRVEATNPTDNGGTQTSWGLWQISLGNHDAPPGWDTPQGNAKLAIGKLDGQGLSAWGTYDSGAYKQYLSGGTSPDTNFPSGPGAASGAAGAATTASLASNQGGSTACLIGFPGFAGLGSFCVISKSQARGVLGAALMAVAVPVAAVGLLIVAASAFASTGAGHAAGGALETAGAGLAFIPGAQGAGIALGAAGAASRRAGSNGAGRQSLDRRQQARAAQQAQAAQQARAAQQAQAANTGEK
jgi:Lysozyme like domain